MFLQTFLLALTARGLGTCVQVSIAGYPEIVREQLNIPDEYAILCGLAIGYPDPTFPANILHRPQPDREHVVFHEPRTVSLLVASASTLPSQLHRRTPSARRRRSDTAPCPPIPAARRHASDTMILLAALRITSSVSSNASSSVK